MSDAKTRHETAHLFQGAFWTAGAAFAGMLALSAAAIHWARVRQSLAAPGGQWLAASCMVFIIALALSPFVEQRRWPFAPAAQPFFVNDLTTHLEKVYDQIFRNETVDVDGRDFIRCTFDNVVLRSNGDNFRITSATFMGTRRILVNAGRIYNVLLLLQAMGALNNITFEEMPSDFSKPPSTK